MREKWPERMIESKTVRLVSQRLTRWHRFKSPERVKFGNMHARVGWHEIPIEVRPLCKCVILASEHTLLPLVVAGGAVLHTAQLHDLLQLLRNDSQVTLDLAR